MRLALLVLILSSRPCWAIDATAEDFEFFENNIRPVLVEHCYECHSSQSPNAKGGLLLDHRQGLVEGGDSGASLVPHKPEESLLISALRYESLEMPPNGKLPAAVIADFELWIAMGAPDPRESVASQGKPRVLYDAQNAQSHWAFQSIANPPPPPLHDAWIRNPIDAFILQSLRESGLEPSPTASPAILYRRLAFSMTGLPYTGSVLAEYEHVVDALLASPEYGVHWGRHWLDIARYADNSGDRLAKSGRNPYYPHAWTYRDWVIAAFNKDQPYDQFVQQQLAGDMMVSESDRTSLAALGFLRVGQLFGQSIDDRIDDRIDTVSKAFLGLTVSCARCHDHKFDPLYTRDYYAWHGIFNSSEDMDVDLIPRELIAGHAEYAQERAEIELDTKTQARKGLERFLSNYVGQTATLLLAAQKFIDGETQATAIAAAAREFGIEADIFEAWVCALQKWQTEANRVFIPWFKLKQFSPEEYERIRDGEWGVHPIVARRLWQQQPINREALATFYSQLAAETEVLAQGHFPLAELIVNWRNLQRNWIAEEYDAFHDAPAPLEDPALEELRQVLLGFEGPWGGPQLPPQKLLRSGAAASRDQIKMTDFALIKKDGEDPRAPVMAMAMRDVPLPQNSHEFIRGDRSNLGEEAPRGYLAHFTTIDQEPYVTGSGRYQLARDIAHRDNPLTARVIVNRVWQWNFGVGLVSTPSDFGLGGIAPSHPELLDWLASWFIEHDWSIKQLNRLIVTSNTYQQASHPREEGEAIDPSNRLLWRFTPRQLSYEESRDSLLMSSGELDLAVGGRSIPQADESQRRTVFLYVDRYELPHRYRVFDFANPDFSTGTRESSIVSPQALYFLNDNWIFARAQHLSHIIATPSTKTDDKVMVLWKAIYRREPTDEELQLACTLLKDSGEDFAGLVHALMCTNEFIFVR